MSSLTDPVKILARRFAALPPQVRLSIAERMLRWRDEESKEASEGLGVRRQSLLERFWDEVEEAHGDGLYLTNPFADGRPQPALFQSVNPDRCLTF